MNINLGKLGTYRVSFYFPVCVEKLVSPRVRVTETDHSTVIVSREEFMAAFGTPCNKASTLVPEGADRQRTHDGNV